MWTDASRNLSHLHSSHPASTDDELELTLRAQRSVWSVLAIIGAAEVVFGMWLLRLLTHG